MDVIKINTLHNRIDVDRTAANAEEVLSDYQHRGAKVRRSQLTVLQSPRMDGMPHSSNPHGLEERIIRGLNDEQYIQQCQNVVAAIEEEEYRNILKYLYIKPLPTVEMAMDRMAMRTTAFYNNKKKALVAFAELWPPSPSELLVYK